VNAVDNLFYFYVEQTGTVKEYLISFFIPMFQDNNSRKYQKTVVILYTVVTVKVLGFRQVSTLFCRTSSGIVHQYLYIAWIIN